MKRLTHALRRTIRVKIVFNDVLKLEAMRSICLYFKIHQPVRLRKFRFFDIGNSEHYYDDYTNEMILRRVTENCYLPANKIILDLITKHRGKFKVAFSISGTAIDQFMKYAPKVIESFQELADTGCVEFLSETYFHSLAVRKNRSEFKRQIESHSVAIESLFGKRPTVFANTELIYSDEIGALIGEMGYKAILTEGPSLILKWKNPNRVYCNAINPEIKVLLKNDQMSADIAFRFSNHNWIEWPLTAQKYVSWLKKIPKGDQVVNLFVDYETFGEHQKSETGIFNFLESLPSAVFRKTDFEFMTPSDVVANYPPISMLYMPYPVEWNDQEKDLTAWFGNELQQDAFEELYRLSDMIELCTDPALIRDWQNLQTSDHFYYMSTKYFAEGRLHAHLSPYESPYEAFINYMNVLNDFSLRLTRNVKENEDKLILQESGWH